MVTAGRALAALATIALLATVAGQHMPGQDHKIDGEV